MIIKNLWHGAHNNNFQGSYVGSLDEDGRFIIPKAYRRILARNAESRRGLHFGKGLYLRVYTQAAAHAYLEELNSERISYPCGSPGYKTFDRWLSITLMGKAKYSLFGVVTIPELFIKVHSLKLGGACYLYGRGNYFEVRSEEVVTTRQ